ncbi:MAG TPA: hypothetical protein VN182_05125 [Flavobacterium sp.]|nr:hypothetical protein [Flavobacterium sp.]
MKNSVIKLFFMFFVTTFSLIWISEKLSMLYLESEKYSYFETTETTDSENITENKLKTLFVNQIDFSDLTPFSLSNSRKINLAYSFKVKEFCFECLTPPPEIVKLFYKFAFV